MPRLALLLTLALLAFPASALADPLAGSDHPGTNHSSLVPGRAEAYRMVAARNGTAAGLSVLLDERNQATQLVLGLYADNAGEPGALLGSTAVATPATNAWNALALQTPVALAAGHAYWLAVFNPSSSGGNLGYWDRPQGLPADKERSSASFSMASLPATWSTMYNHFYDTGGPLSGYAFEAAPVVTPTPTPTPVAAASPAPAPTPPPVVQAAPAPPLTPVGAWGFEEAGGKLALDSSGHGNTGTIAGARRVPGWFGQGLSFNGSDNWVTVPDSASLNFTGGLTVEAWVRPSRGGTLQTLAVKEAQTGLAWGLYGGARASGNVFTTGEQWTQAKLARNRWSYVAVTYDGARVWLFVNGAPRASVAQGGPLATSTDPLRFGGNALWKEWLKGRLDELRVYARPLSLAEIRRDMVTPVTRVRRAALTRSSTGHGAGKVRYRASAPHRRASSM